MNSKQYNFIIDWTLKHNNDLDSKNCMETARTIFKNMGIALPNGNMKDVYEIIKTENYMGWRKCDIIKAQEFVEKGTAVIGINENEIVILTAFNKDNNVINNDSTILMLSEKIEESEVSEYELYSYSATRSGSSNSRYNLDYCNNFMLTSNQLKLLSENKQYYKDAAALYNIPWKLLAVIHYREYGFKRGGPANGDGPYQIWGSNYPVGDYTADEFLEATIDAAAFIKEKAGNLDLSLLKNIKLVLFRYNGIANEYKQQALNMGFTQEEANIGEGSPYVMNRADKRRDPTVEPTKSNNTWGQIMKDNGPIEYPANSDYGAYVLYNAL